MGVYSEEEALAKCTANGSRERRMVLKKPMIKLVGDDKVPVICVYPERYTEDDLVLDCLSKSKTNEPYVDDPKPLSYETFISIRSLSGIGRR